MKKLQTEFLNKQEENKITIHKYYEMLEVVPPAMQAPNGFLVGEAYRHGKDQSGEFSALYQLFFYANGEYYNGGLASIKAFLID